MNSYRRRFARKIPDFGSNDEEYKMNTSRTFETERIREHMKISLDFINYLIENGWVAEDSEVIDNMNKVWLDIWNEYVSVREAVEGQKVKEDLFGGGAAYYPGQKTMLDLHKLVVGDCIRDNYDSDYKLSGKTKTHVNWMQKGHNYIGDALEIDKNQPTKEWTYLGRDIWTP